MGEIRTHEPVLLILAAFSRHEPALEWARQTCEQSWGKIALTSPVFEFSETRFYESTMGREIKKLFWAFEDLVDPARLVELKHVTNVWEEQLKNRGEFEDVRPLNLDPGYLTEAKLVLATTKDRDHRMYLDLGIYAEVTLVYQELRWQSRPWTYPDYRRADYHQFFDRCRDYLRRRYGKSTPPLREE